MPVTEWAINKMKFLNWNHVKVQNLTSWEIWFFVAGRVLMSFGLGVLAVMYIPDIAIPLAYPALVIGFILIVLAGRGLFRSPEK